ADWAKAPPAAVHVTATTTRRKQDRTFAMISPLPQFTINRTRLAGRPRERLALRANLVDLGFRAIVLLELHAVERGAGIFVELVGVVPSLDCRGVFPRAEVSDRLVEILGGRGILGERIVQIADRLLVVALGAVDHGPRV